MASVIEQDLIEGIEMRETQAEAEQQEFLFVVRDPVACAAPSTTDAPPPDLKEALAREAALRRVVDYLIGEFREIDPENPALKKEARFSVYQQAYQQAVA